MATVGVTVVPIVGATDRADRQHLVRGLDQRVDAILRFEPGVCRATFDDDFERAASLATDFEVPTVR